jgi:hypothetical protein
VLRPTPPACSVSSRSTRDSLAVPLPSTSLPASSRDTSTATSTERTLRLCVRPPLSVYPYSGLELTLSDTALVHVVGAMILLGYAQNYYFHLRMSSLDWIWIGQVANCRLDRSPQEQRPLNGATQWKRTTVCETAWVSKVKAPVIVIIQHKTESEVSGLFSLCL